MPYLAFRIVVAPHGVRLVHQCFLKTLPRQDPPAFDGPGPAVCNPDLSPISAQISTREDLDNLIVGLETANFGGAEVLGAASEELVVLLAPNNAAFERLAEVLNAPVEGLLSEPAVLKTLLKYHLIQSGGTCDGQLTGELTTAQGESLAFSGNGTVTDANGNQANILEIIEALNGAVLVIDTVLLPLGQ
jgi:hypothetical protein